MKAARYEQFGEPAQVIAPAEIPTPEPPPGMIRVRMLRAPIHNHDLATVRGIYGNPPPLPAVGGTELAGMVDALGEGVSQPAVGTRVAAAIPSGAWAEFALVHPAGAVPVPAAIEDDLACQLLAMPMSAVVLFEELRVKSGDWIVQNAANGAVGKLLVQLANEHGVNIINIVRSAQAAGELQDIGAEHIVVGDGDWQAKVRAIAAGAPIVRAVDSIAGKATQELLGVVAHRGEAIVFGGLSGSPIKLNPSTMIAGEYVVRGFWMSSWMTRASNEDRVRVIATVFDLATKGQLTLPVRATMPLADVKNALEMAETPSRGGKILVKP